MRDPVTKRRYCWSPLRRAFVLFHVTIFTLFGGACQEQKGDSNSAGSPDTSPVTTAEPAKVPPHPAKLLDEQATASVKSVGASSAVQGKTGTETASASNVLDVHAFRKRQNYERQLESGKLRRFNRNYASPGRKSNVKREMAGGSTEKLTIEERIRLDGRFRRLVDRPDNEMTPEQREQAAALEAIGYLSGSTPAVERINVVVNQPDKTYGKYNFYTSGHDTAGFLIGMDGALIHSWRFDHSAVLPNHDIYGAESYRHWRRAHLFENGDVIAIIAGVGIVKVDKDSKLIWCKQIGAHHDFEVMPSGEIFVLTRKAHMIPRLNRRQPILEDFVTILDADGNEIHSFSLIEALEDTEFYKLWPESRPRRGDVFHTNTLHVLDGRIADRVPEFKKDNLLISIHRLHVVAVVDMETEKIVWAHRGNFRLQHDPKILANGNMLIFDNKNGQDTSKVIEIDPATKKEVWRYEGSEDEPFYTATCGTSERLPNGNTLIVESDGGRAFEVDAEKNIVWEFFNPHRAGENDEYIATLFDVVRLPESFPVNWIAAESDASIRSEDAEAMTSSQEDAKGTDE